MKYHQPVLKEKVIELLKVNKGDQYIDCTLGDGGHTIEILKLGGKVLGIDISEHSLKRARERINNMNCQVDFVGAQGNFRNIDSIANRNGFNEVRGILYDLGYSSYQLEDSDTGISFLKDQPLDMRLDPDLGVTAADLINSLSEKELSNLIFDLSGERLSKRIARSIISYRSLKKLQTTKELADIISSIASPDYENGRIHPATRTFQALRIAVNDELNNLELSLPRAAHLLLPGGRIIVISFQSLEDKITKNFGQGAQPILKSITDKPLVPDDEEIEKNIRSRSAKMRVFEKV